MQSAEAAEQSKGLGNWFEQPGHTLAGSVARPSPASTARPRPVGASNELGGPPDIHIVGHARWFSVAGGGSLQLGALGCDYEAAFSAPSISAEVPPWPAHSSRAGLGDPQ
jgi:hypothetical protein